jgi:hypothetical protein
MHATKAAGGLLTHSASARTSLPVLRCGKKYFQAALKATLIDEHAGALQEY